MTTPATRIRTALQAARMLREPFDQAWAEACPRVLAGVRDRTERYEWRDALAFARPYFDAAYHGRELPLCVQAIPELEAALSGDTDFELARQRVEGMPLGSALTKEQRDHMRARMGVGPLPGPKPRRH